MRKDNFLGKRMNFYSRYRIKGRNGDALLNILNSRGIEVFNAKKTDDKTLILSIKNSECEKFFAITEELCYTIIKIRDYGLLYPLYKLTENLFLFVGIICFFFLVYFSNGCILEIEYTGTGNIYERQIEAELKAIGIEKFSSFPSGIKRKEAEINLARKENILFASLEKKGNRLIVNTVAREGAMPLRNDNVKSFMSDVDGVVESLKIYSGTALCNVGDEIKRGDVLAEGKKTVKEQTVEENLSMDISIICERVIDVSLRVENDDVAFLLAKELFNGEITGYKIKKEKREKNFLYKISLFYRVIYVVG